MATIRKRKNGRFQAIIRLAGFTAETKTFTNVEDATMWAEFRERELGRVLNQFPPAKPDIILRDALIRYRSEITPHKKSSDREGNRIAIWLCHPLSSKPMRDIKGADLAQHRSIRLALGKKPNTIRLELAIISHVFEVARSDWGLEMLSNPHKAMRKSSLGGVRDRRLKSGEFEALMAWCDFSENSLFKVALIMAVETAMRRGELTELLWDNVDLSAQLAYLPDTKNSTPRTVPLSKAAVTALRCIGPKYSGRVFNVHEDWLTKRFIAARSACGLVNLRFHDLRHEAVSRLFEKGFNMMEAATVSGHKTLQMLKRYTHLDPRSLLARLG